MLQDKLAINVMGVLVRFVPKADSTVRDAVGFAIKATFGEGKGVDSYALQASLRGQALSLDTPLALVEFTVGDMLNVEFVR